MSLRFHVFFTLLEIFVQFLGISFFLIQTIEIIPDEAKFRILIAPQILKLLLYFCQSLLLLLQEALLHRQISLQQRWHLRTIVYLKQIWDPHLPILVNDQFEVLIFLWKIFIFHIIPRTDAEIICLLDQVTEKKIFLLADTVNTLLEHFQDAIIRDICAEGDPLKYIISVTGVTGCHF